MRNPRSASLVLASLLLTGPVGVASAAVGTVVDADHEPLQGARVCYIQEKVELLCVATDRDGRFSLPASEVDTVRVIATDYLPRTFSAAAQQAPVVLRRSPTLFVRLVEGSSGRALASGEVFVTFSSGREIGPFPANAAGVRISRLIHPGEVRVTAKSAGFRDAGPQSVRLVAGEEAEVVLELEPGTDEDDEQDP